MADNTVLNSGSGGNTFRTFQDADTIHWPGGVTCFLTSLGTPDVAVPVLPTQGLPVRLADASGYLSALPVTDNGGSLTVDGTVAVTGTFWQATQPVSAASLPLPTGAATDASLTAISLTVNTLLDRTPELGQALAAASTPVVLTAAQLSTLTPLASVAVTNAGTFAVQAAQSGTWSVTDGGGSLTVDGSVSVSGLVPGTTATSLGKAEDAVAADGDTGVAVWAVRKDTAATTVGADGDYHPFEVDGNGRLWVNGSSVTQPVSGTFWQATQPVSLASVPTHDIGTVTTVTGVTTVSTVTTCSTVTALTTLTGSGVAHDGADSGNPHKVGAKATTSLSGLTPVANADRTDLFAGVDGVLITRPHTNLEGIVSGVAAITDGSSTSVISAQGSGVKVYVTSVIIRNSSATDVGVDLRDGAAGTVKATFPAPPNGGGCVHQLPVPLPFSANTAVCADPSAAASTVTVTLIGFTSKV